MSPFESSVPVPRLRAFSRLAGRRPLLAGLLGTSISVAVVVLTLVVLLAGRQQALDRGLATSTDLAVALSREIGRNVELYDLSLQAVAESAIDPRVSALPDDLRRKILFDRSTAARYVSGVFVVDRNGNITIGRDNRIFHVNVADRDYFVAQKARGGSGLFVSRPYASRARDNAQSIALSRRISLPDGSFGGIAALAANLDYFELMLKEVSIGPRGAAIIIQTDGTVVARNPPLKTDEPRSVAQSPTFGRMQANDQGFYVTRSPVDGVRRLYAFAHVPGSNLIAIVAPSYDDLLADWRRRSTVIGVLSILLSGAFAYVVWALVFGLQYRIALQTQVNRMADTDPLTGVANRRSLEKSLRQIWDAHRQDGKALSVLFVDADYFKEYNDQHGHEAGDDALRYIADCLKSQVRAGVDVIARYGGEEFVVVLPDTALSAAVEAAERIRASVERGTIASTENGLSPVTVSVGCAVVTPAEGATMATAVRAADRALYIAKHRGRNRVSVATADMYEDAQRHADVVTP
ncbi:GGDEF domain-containing protein [Paraburkholderia sp. Tr-20389]|uniref:sensor domain-containing diguanylate cyclase n=1 Tax=Paraburkholderia sp. Tr-20389 TaxID=2703903 RepID=UPI0019800231|nr:GGDEF domain-containing protein [Paraburkholderia sp. Tr-20389]MBN3756402.1 GGDEF domain-containing protein [Paraburkholderia sp. Tr-20389]